MLQRPPHKPGSGVKISFSACIGKIVQCTEYVSNFFTYFIRILAILNPETGANTGGSFTVK